MQPAISVINTVPFDRRPEVGMVSPDFFYLEDPSSYLENGFSCGSHRPTPVCPQGPVVQQANLPPDQSEIGMLPSASREICCNIALDISWCKGLRCTLLGAKVAVFRFHWQFSFRNDWSTRVWLCSRRRHVCKVSARKIAKHMA